jgi:hypothetical protein
MAQRVLAVSWGVLCGLVGCGGLVSGRFAPDGGGMLPEAAPTPEGGLEDGSADGGGPGWTQCAAPDGVSICGNDACGDPRGCVCFPADSGLELCEDSPGYGIKLCAPCESDQVCLSIGATDDPSPVWSCEPWNAGELFAINGAASRVRYSDFASWQGPNIQAPPSCAAVAEPVVLCGGACGDCEAGALVCTGRSPLHPFGWCAISPLAQQCAFGSNTCSSGNACFTYKVDGDAQAFADANGYCLATDMCDGLAAQLPGGGTCTH